MVNAEKDLSQWVVSGHASILAGNGPTTSTLAQPIHEIVNNESLSLLTCPCNRNADSLLDLEKSCVCRVSRQLEKVFFQDLQHVSAVFVLDSIAEPLQLFLVDVPLAVCNLFGTSDL